MVLWYMDSAASHHIAFDIQKIDEASSLSVNIQEVQIDVGDSDITKGTRSSTTKKNLSEIKLKHVK